MIEDDAELADSLAAALKAQLYKVDIARDGEAGELLLQSNLHDVILLDVALPKMDGLSLCRQLRARGDFRPIIMLTARDANSDKVIGLDSGADVYMVKPFDLQELFAQIRAILRRQRVREPAPTLEWNGLTLNSLTYEVSYQSSLLNLSPKEFAILELLMQNGRRVMGRASIIESLWPPSDPPEEETIKSHVKSLRSKLRKAGAQKNFIETVYGVGYRLSNPPSSSFN